MNIVIVGHVDHGKSTIIGRLMADTHSLPENKLEQIQERCMRNSKPFEYAFLLDALKEEQDQGITIDIARCFFKSKKREYMILDAPGHVEFIKNMITGAAKAEAALLVIDAKEGIKENSKRHAYILSMLGIKQVSVLVNKMDLINYDEEKYNKLVSDYTSFLKEINIQASSFIPVSGVNGDNIVSNSNNITWYKGRTVLEQLDSFTEDELLINKPFRMPIQGIYKFTENNDTRRIIAGQIESGEISVGDEVIIYPSKKKTKIKTIESFNTEKKEKLEAGYSAAFTFEDELYIKRGEVLVKTSEEKPKIADKLMVNIFWLGKSDLVEGKEYIIKNGTAKVKGTITKIVNTMDAATLVQKKDNCLKCNEIGEIILSLKEPIAFDYQDSIPDLSRFVIVDNYDISGGGIIKKVISKNISLYRENLISKSTDISISKRNETYNQEGKLIIVTGNKEEVENVSRNLEHKLFNEKKYVLYIGFDFSNFDRDIGNFINLLNEFLKSGIILICGINNCDNNQLLSIKKTIDNVQIINVNE